MEWKRNHTRGPAKGEKDSGSQWNPSTSEQLRQVDLQCERKDIVEDRRLH